MIGESVRAARTAEDKLNIIADELDRLMVAQLHAAKPVQSREVGKPAESYLEKVREVFAHWQTVMNRPRATLTQERREKIEARLRQGYTVERICRAIEGCHGSDFHMARGEYQGQGHNQHLDVTLICRTGSKLEEFELMPKRGGDGPNTKFLGN